MMTKENDNSRVILDANATKVVGELRRKLKSKGPYYSATQSRLVSLIICNYFDRGYYDKNQKFFEHSFFNEKKYLRSVLNSGGDLRSALKEIDGRYKAKPGVTNKN